MCDFMKDEIVEVRDDKNKPWMRRSFFARIPGEESPYLCREENGELRYLRSWKYCRRILEFPDIEVDTPVLVSHSQFGTKYHAHFAKWDRESNVIVTFRDGKTSWSISDYDPDSNFDYESWEYWEIVEE